MSVIVDLFAACSIVGIWPRFIEPRTLKTTELCWNLPVQAKHLAGLKIVHLSDLHFHTKLSQAFLDKITRRIEQLKPDLLLFTGDFLCYSTLEDGRRLASFLNRLHAPLGAFCCLGNHDYANYVSLSRKGVYDLLPPPKPLPGLMKGIKILFSKPHVGIKVSERALSISLHKELCALLHTTPFTLLENRTTTLPIGLNISGLGDLSLGRCRPEIAFEDYNSQFPGIVLSHNPDSVPSLLKFPGDWILSGHTHGEQIHLPWPKWGRALTKKLARLQNCTYTRGLYSLGAKKNLYVNRGLGCHKPFRFLSPPEILLIKTR